MTSVANVFIIDCGRAVCVYQLAVLWSGNMAWLSWIPLGLQSGGESCGFLRGLILVLDDQTQFLRGPRDKAAFRVVPHAALQLSPSEKHTAEPPRG